MFRLNLLSTVGVFVLCGFLWSQAAPLAAAEEAESSPDKPAQKITYDDHVRPILLEHCFTCHNQNDANNDLALDTYGRLIQGGAGGAAIEPGNADASRLWLLMAHLEEPAMPPEQDKLPDEKLAVIRDWITAGALENAGSKAKIKKKPTMDLSATAGSTKPEGDPVVPVGLWREPIVYTPRSAAVTAIAASPWAPVVAVGGQRQVVLYNTQTAELFGILPFPEGIPHVARFSRSGSLLLVGGGRGGQAGRVVVFDVKTGSRVFEIGEELDTVLAADINEDHSMIALGGPGRTVRIFSTADGELVHEIQKHTEWVYALEFSPDGVLLTSADRNGGMFVWESETGREYLNLKGHGSAVTDVSWRLDSNVMASASEDGTVRLWEMENGGQIKSWNAHAGGVASVSFTHDGRLVSAGRDKQVKIWNQNGEAQRAFEALPDLALDAAFNHDGTRVIGGDWSGQVRMWEAAEGKQIATLAANPPTLAMVVQRETARAAELQAAAEKAAAELAAAQKDATDKAAAAKAAADAAAQKAAVAAQAAEQAAAAKALAAKAAAEKAAYEQHTAQAAATP